MNRLGDCLTTDDAGGLWGRSFDGFPVPRIYRVGFGSQSRVDLHWHWFWSSAHTLHVLRPPSPGVTADVAPAVIEALARALVADVLAHAEISEQKGDEL